MAQVRANEASAEGQTLNKHLKIRDLIAFGIAAIIGAGIFSTIGQASAQGGLRLFFYFFLRRLPVVLQLSHMPSLLLWCRWLVRPTRILT